MLQTLHEIREQLADELGYTEGVRLPNHLVVQQYGWDITASCEMIESYSLECSHEFGRNLNRTISLPVLERLTRS